MTQDRKLLVAQRRYDKALKALVANRDSDKRWAELVSARMSLEGVWRSGGGSK